MLGGEDGAVGGRRTVGRYVLLDQVGSGSMGVVFRAYDPELDRPVAVKLLRIQGAGTTGDGSTWCDVELQRARFVREARTMAKVSHPNVAPVFDVGTDGSSMYIAMELLCGDTMRAWLRRERPWSEVLELFAQAGRGLVAAHDAGLVHRDFKPSNVMLEDRADGERRARVVDFGLAMPAASADTPTIRESEDIEHSVTITLPGMTVGTPAYMAPEVHAGGPADARSDQFSFCASLFEALHGYRPFRGRTAKELAHQKYTGAIKAGPAPRGVPAWLDRIVRRGLAARPEARFPSMRALLAALQHGRPRAGRRRAATIAGLAFGFALSAAATIPFAGGPALPAAPRLAAVRSGPAATNWDARLADAQRLVAAGRPRLAERELEDLYFTAVEGGEKTEASRAARELAELLARRGRVAESRRWTRHARAWRG